MGVDRGLANRIEHGLEMTDGHERWFSMEYRLHLASVLEVESALLPACPYRVGVTGVQVKDRSRKNS